MTAVAVQLAPLAKQRFTDGNGNPLSGGKLFTYAAGTTTKQNTYTDSSGTIANANPVILDSRGEAFVWLDQSLSYKLVLSPSTDSDPPTNPVWTIDNVRDPTGAVLATLAAVAGASIIGYQQASPAVAPRTVYARLKDRWHIKDFVETGDGSTWHQAIQRAADSKELVDFDPVSYDVGEESNLQSGARLRGGGSYSVAASTHATDGVTTLNYVGSGGTNSCVIRIANAAVGVLPTDPDNANIQNVTFTGFVVQCNGIPDIGIYGVRCTQGNMLDFLTVVGSLKHAFSMGECFGGGGLRGWLAFKNRGASFSLGMGAQDWGWASDTFEQCVLESPFAYFGGCDASGNPLNVFDESGSFDVNAGFRIGGGRGLQIINLQAAQCDGPGIYAMPEFDPILVNGGYIEFCGRSNKSTRQWATAYEGAPSGINPYLRWNSLRFGGAPAQKMNGTAPSRLEGGPLFENCPIIGSVDAAWSNYRLIDCDRNVAYVGAGFRPTNFDRMRSTDSSMTVSGVSRFTTAAGAVSGLRKNGVFAPGITRTSAGLFVAGLSETCPHGFNLIFGSVPAGWEINEVSRTSTSVTFTTLLASVATDPTTFNVQLTILVDYD